MLIASHVEVTTNNNSTYIDLSVFIKDGVTISLSYAIKALKNYDIVQYMACRQRKFTLVNVYLIY